MRAAADGSPYRAVLSAGVGGGFPGQAETGATVVGTRSIAADLGAESPDGFLPVEELGFGARVVEADAALLRSLAWLPGDYHLLPCGGALGRGRGPLVPTGGERTDLGGATVAVPGERTTAYLLFRLWSAEHPPAKVEVVPFDQIIPTVADGTYDAELLIH